MSGERDESDDAAGGDISTGEGSDDEGTSGDDEGASSKA